MGRPRTQLGDGPPASGCLTPHPCRLPGVLQLKMGVQCVSLASYPASACLCCIELQPFTYPALAPHVSQLCLCSVLELDGNEAAVSLCLVRFTSWPEEGLVLAVGTVQGLAFYPRTADGAQSTGSLWYRRALINAAWVESRMLSQSMWGINRVVFMCAEGYIRLYRFKDNGRQLELIHKTPTGGIPGALAAFKGRLLAGVGATLRIYEAGKKKLLRKCEHRKLPTHIAALATSGDRIFVGDLQVCALTPAALGVGDLQFCLPFLVAC